MRRRYNNGFSLTELMVSMVIGLLIIAGAGTVFVSNQRSSVVKQELDSAQEAFRFASYTISRVVRNADTLAVPAANELVVTFEGDPRILDCRGLPTTPPTFPGETVTNTFTLEPDPNHPGLFRLRCEGVTLVRGIVDPPSPRVFFEEILDLNDNAVAVRTDLQMESGLSGTFTATARGQVVALYARQTAVNGNGEEGNGEEGNGEEGNGDGEGNGGEGNGGEGNGGEGNGGEGNGGDGNGGASNGGGVSAVTCNCFYQNHIHRYSVVAGSHASCTISCCSSNDTGSGNNRAFSITVQSCS